MLLSCAFYKVPVTNGDSQLLLLMGVYESKKQQAVRGANKK